MKRLLKQTPAAIIVIILSVVGLAPAVSAAGTATLSFSPASGTVDNGSVLTVGVYEDSGTDTVNAVQANFSYPDGLLSCYGSTPIANSSAFGVAAQNVCSGGSVKIGRGAFSAVSGKQLVATVYFQAIAGSGTAALTFDSSSSQVVRSTDHQSEALTVQNGSYTLSTKTASGTGGTGGTSTSGSGSTKTSSSSSSSSSSKSTSSGSTSTSTAAPTKLTISSVSISDISSDTATVTWRTSVPATSEVDYGPTTSYGLSVVSSQLTLTHSLKLSSQDLRSSLVYHYVVRSFDAAGQSATSADRTFETAADGSLNFGQPSSQTKSYLIVALVAIGVIAVVAVAAAVYIRRMHAASLISSHVLQGPSSTGTTTLPSNNPLVTPQNPAGPAAGNTPGSNQPSSGPKLPPSDVK